MLTPFFPALAPLTNDQTINPWTANVYYGPVTYQGMSAGDAGLEKAIVERVASYGRQLGRVTEALGVLVRIARGAKRNTDDDKALDAFVALATEIEAAKARYTGSDADSLARFERSLAYLKRTDPEAYEHTKLRLKRLLQAG
jgi:hypothetical protein